MFRIVETPARGRLRRVALPSEHGSWGLVGEPLVLGLAVAPSWRGLLLAVAVLATFLARQPLKIVANDRVRGVRSARTELALNVAIAYLAVAAATISMALVGASTSIFWPVVAAAPFAIIQLLFDARGRSRHVIAELCGAAAMSAAASVVALAAGWPLMRAAALSVLMLCRSIPAVLYVRARLRLERGEKRVRTLPTAAHIVALVALVAIGERTLMPVFVLLPFAFLLVRGVVGLSPWRQTLAPKQIGYREVAYGAAVILVIVVAYHA